MFEINKELSDVKGLGEVTINKLNQKDIFSIDDLINFLPISYVYYSNDLIESSVKLSFKGIITSQVNNYQLRNNLTITNFIVSDGKQEIKVVAWNQKHLKYTYKKAMEVEVKGNYDYQKNELSLQKIKLASSNQLSQDIIPIYSKINKLSNLQIQKMIINCLDELDDFNKLIMLEIHNPISKEKLIEAQTKYKVWEFSNYYLKIQAKLTNRQKESDQYKIKIDMNIINQKINDLPFSLTKSQEEVIISGLKKLEENTAMQSLILGDVGSGKTIVCFIYALAVINNQKQVVIMAPTEILAKQIYSEALKYLSEYKVGLLVGSLTKKNKQKIKEQISFGLLNLIIGTQALIEEDLVFKNLGLAIIDEQQRFGVNQREQLLSKSSYINYCYLSATPIPRTIAHTIFGVIDVLELNEKPRNRIDIITKIYNDHQKKEIMDIIEKELNLNNKVYVVAPLVSEVDDLALADVMSTHQKYLKYFKGQYKIEVVHGKMKSSDKDQVMQNFKAGDSNILISTTVIEVGVDIPEATVILILNAERYGVAQLHQLRGRVGRNNLQSYCLLYNQSKSEVSKKRLELLTKYNDGYKLSQEDYKLRGMGEVVGIRQSGSEDFKLFDFNQDLKIIKKVILDKK